MMVNFPDQQSFQALLWKAVMLPLLLALVLAGLFFFQVRSLQTAARWVDHSNGIISQARLLERLVIDAQTSVRGYLLTSDVEYLKPYQKSVTRIPIEFENLKTQLTPGSEQKEATAVLKIKVDNWLTYTISLLHERIRNRSHSSFNSNRRGEDLMNGIRNEFDEINQRETVTRNVRAREVDKAAKEALWSGIGLCFLIGLTLAFSTRRVFFTISNSYGGAFKKLEKSASDLEGALNMRDEFLSIASHELKTPLTSLKLNLQMTQRGMRSGENGLPDPARLKKAIDASINQVSRLDGLVEDLLDISRIQAGKLKQNFEAIDLSQLLNEIMERCGEEFEKAGCALATEIEPSLEIECDAFRIEQVVLNLLTNAMKYAPGKPVKVSLRAEGAHVRIQVADQGIGIDESKQHLVFERFERVTSVQNITGLGLGLYIVKKIVSAHQGTASVESELGKGSTFSIILPRKQIVSSIVEQADSV
ncbi:MAG: CHASE3 domain-containing protein [Bdellovibrionales bacterium]|nr:CHASE3 domain-containing protein [Oligoflexia bacterium]